MKEQFEFRITAIQLVGILIFAGLVLRLLNLEIIGLWMDEIHSVVGTDPDKTVAEVIEYCKTDQPPLFFLLLHGWFKIFPYSDLSGRILATLTGLLGILAMYHLGKEYKNYKVGVVAAFLTTINYFHVDHSRQIRFYPLVFLFSALSYYFFIRILKRKKLADFIFYILATSALVNTHYFGMVVFASQFILFIGILIWKKIKDVRFISSCLLSGVVIGLSFLHWLPVVLADLEIDQFHVAPLKWYFPIEYFVIYFRDYVSVIICGVLGFLGLRQIFRYAKSESLQIQDVVLVGWIVLAFLIPALYSVLRMPMLEYKYSFIAVPAILLMIAIGFDSISIEKLKLPVLAVLLLAFGIHATFINSIYYRKPLEQWRELSKELTKTDSNTQLVFSEYAWYYRYYFKINKSIYPPLEPRYADFNTLIKNASRIWILQSKRFPDRGLTPEQQQQLDLQFKYETQVEFVDVIGRSYIRR